MADSLQPQGKTTLRGSRAESPWLTDGGVTRMAAANSAHGGSGVQVLFRI